jgi:hypothetical protein
MLSTPIMGKLQQFQLNRGAKKNLKSVSKQEPAVCKQILHNDNPDFGDSIQNDDFRLAHGNFEAAYWEDVTCKKCLELFKTNKAIRNLI